MKCYSCGAEIREEAFFCTYCGADQRKRPAEEPEAAPVTAEETPVAEPVIEAAPVAEDAPVAAEAPVVQPAVPEETPAVEEPVAAEEAPVAEPVPVATPEPPAAPQPVPQPVQQPVYQQVQPQQPVYQPPVYQQTIFQQPVYQQVIQIARPALQLPTNRSMVKYFLLGLVTLLIYPMVILSQISMEINMVASRHDGKRTMHYLWMLTLMPLTLGINLFVWIHNLCNRMGAEAKRRGIDYKFSAASYWLWNIVWPASFAAGTSLIGLILLALELESLLVILICSVLAIVGFVGTFIFFHKFFKTMNLINADYNQKG